MRRPALQFAVVVVTLWAAAAHAQVPPAELTEASAATADTRAAAEPAAADNAQQSPEGDGYIDRTRRWAKNAKLFERMNGTTDGWYPRFGGLTRGGGLPLGAGYRMHVLNDVLVDASAAASFKAYVAADLKARWLRAHDSRFELWTDFRYEAFPQEDFFGIGFNTSEANETSYERDTVDAALRAQYKPIGPMRIGAILGYMWPRISSGHDRDVPSAERIFGDIEAPGIFQQPSFLHMSLFAEVDVRDAPGLPTTGGFYRVAFSGFDDRNLNRYDFHRLDAEGTHYVPLSPDRKHVISGRFGAAYANNKTGNRVPFYFLPYVGGVDTLRSFREFRFQDENALWLSAEYRYTVLPFLSLAAFVDAGEVRADWEEIGFGDMRHGYGGGFLLHAKRQTFLRFYTGFGGGEGARMFFKIGIF